MAKNDRFVDLQFWQKARELENTIYGISTVGSFSKDYALKDQINRATGSIMNNIAEGFGRGGDKELIHFLIISRSSALEVQSQLYRASDRKHINTTQLREVLERTNQAISIIIRFHQLPERFRKERSPLRIMKNANAERRTPNVKRRTPNEERRTPNEERRTKNEFKDDTASTPHS